MDETLLKAQELYDKSQELEQRIQLIEEHIMKFEDFLKGIHFIDKASENKESFFAPLGNGVFVNAKMNDEFFVDVGAGVIVRKPLEEIKDTVANQIEKLKLAHNELNSTLAEMKEDFEEIVQGIEHNH